MGRVTESGGRRNWSNCSRTDPTPVTSDEAKRMAAAKTHRLGAMFTVAIALGLRPGEALHFDGTMSTPTARAFNSSSATP
jgi:hypothetical protein